MTNWGKWVWWIGAAVFVLLLLPMVAWADNCGSLTDCWGTVGGAAGTAGGIGGALGGGLGGGGLGGDGDGEGDENGDETPNQPDPEGGDDDVDNPCSQ